MFSVTLIEVIMKLRTLAPGAVVSLVTILLVSTNHAEQAVPSIPANGIVLDTYTPDPCSPNGQRHGGCSNPKRLPIRVVPVATGLVRPWHIAFLPDGHSMLVTESIGRLRMVRDGVLDPNPIAGLPNPALKARTLNSVLVHPKFVENHFVYLSYQKEGERGTTLALARGRLDGTTLSDLRDLFVADAWETGGAIAGRTEFGPDGMIYMAIGDRDRNVVSDDASFRMRAQDLGSHIGKVLRLRDDGSVPPDNPFVSRAGAKPEIYTYGHRNIFGLAWHPQTGALWACEIGPLGGDELNVLLPGRNYGWPVVSLGKIYTGNQASEQSWYRPGMEMPVMYWMPAISPSGLAFYTGDRIPQWKGNLFMGSLSGQQLQRIAFNQPLQAERHESLLTQLDVRVRDVHQGPDGYLYVATEKASDGPPPATSAGGIQTPPGGQGPVFVSLDPTGSVLRLEPAN
jgi:aldose sugar dehydrogenase